MPFSVNPYPPRRASETWIDAHNVTSLTVVQKAREAAQIQMKKELKSRQCVAEISLIEIQGPKRTTARWVGQGPSVHLEIIDFKKTDEPYKWIALDIIVMQ